MHSHEYSYEKSVPFLIEKQRKIMEYYQTWLQSRATCIKPVS